MQHRTASRLLALGAVLSLAGSAAAAPPAFEVEVINDAATALPVTIESDDPIPVSIESTAAPEDEVVVMRITGFNPGAQQTVIMDNVELICLGAVPVCDTPGGLYRVPVGKLLVIDTVAVLARTASLAPTLMSFNISFQIDGRADRNFSFPMGLVDEVDPGRRDWAKTFSVKLQVPSNATLRAGALWDVAPGQQVDGVATVSGRLVPAE